MEQEKRKKTGWIGGLLFKEVRFHKREEMGNKRLEDCY